MPSTVCARSGLALLFGTALSIAQRPAAAEPPGDDATPREPGPEHGMTMVLESPAFGSHEEIPREYTCEGDDRAPALAWSGVPDEAQSLALIVLDPDAPDPEAPRMTWVHWIVFDIPPIATGLPEGGEPLPEGAALGMNDFGRTGYGGPCPPKGRHRYVFRLYALDTRLELERPTQDQLERAMEGHVLAEAELVGTYQKVGPR